MSCEHSLWNWWDLKLISNLLGMLFSLFRVDICRQQHRQHQYMFFFFSFFSAFPFYMHIQKSKLHGIFLTVSRLNICNTRLAICNVEMARVWSSVVGWNQKESEKCSCVFRSVGVVRNLWNLFLWNFLVSLYSFPNFWYSECLHWNGGVPSLLEAGANCIKELSTFEVIIKQAKWVTRNYWSL